MIYIDKILFISSCGLIAIERTEQNKNSTYSHRNRKIRITPKKQQSEWAMFETIMLPLPAVFAIDL